MSPRSIARQLRDSPNTQKYVAIALVAVAALLVLLVTLSHPTLR